MPKDDTRETASSPQQDDEMTDDKSTDYSEASSQDNVKAEDQKSMDPSPKDVSKNSNVTLLSLVVISWIMLLLGGAYLFIEMQKTQQQSNQSLATKEQEIAALQKRVDSFESQLKSPSRSPHVSRDLIETIEQNKKTVSRLEHLEDIVRELPTELPVMQHEAIGAASQEELLDLLSRVKRLEDETQAVQTRQADEGRIRQSDKLAPVLVGIFRLRDQILSGEGYQQQLEFLQSLTHTDPVLHASLTKLETALSDGIVTVKELQENFQTVARDVFRAASQEGNTFWDKTKHVVSQGFTVRKTGQWLEGDTVEAILSRAEIYVSRSQLKQAAEQLAQLPRGAKVKAKDWIEQTQTLEQFEAIFAEIYGRASELYADVFEKDNARSPEPLSKPLSIEEQTRLEIKQWLARVAGHGDSFTAHVAHRH